MLGIPNSVQIGNLSEFSDSCQIFALLASAGPMNVAKNKGCGWVRLQFCGKTLNQNVM
jgi:hypothetical protein